MKKVVLVAMAHIRHAWFISQENWSEAKMIRENLESLTHVEDPQLKAMALRAEIAETSSNSPSFEKLIEKAFSRNGLRATMLQLSLLEKCDTSRGGINTKEN